MVQQCAVATDKAADDPLHLLRSNLDQDEAACFWAEFESQVPDLFMSDGESCKIGIARVARPQETYDLATKGTPAQRPGTDMKWASTVNELEAALTERLPFEFCRVLLLSRLNSWSRLNVTVDMFRAIHGFDDIMPQFLKIIMGFRKKLASRDEDYMACYSRRLVSGRKTHQGKAASTDARSCG
ncbi:hypothetical protein GQ53DRAFT_350642 [Thozetella sp. PMI_491]|nr:hypothetical protein GQ53DRAFT_350642 [Thozetella sp. PMI_491]